MGSSRKGRDIDSSLCKKGFRRNSTGDHVYYHFVTLSGRDSIIFTKISHGMMGTAIGSPLISKMARQLHLTKALFVDLIDCPLDKAGYRAILKAQGFDV